MRAADKRGGGGGAATSVHQVKKKKKVPTHHIGVHKMHSRFSAFRALFICCTIGVHLVHNSFDTAHNTIQTLFDRRRAYSTCVPFLTARIVRRRAPALASSFWSQCISPLGREMKTVWLLLLLVSASLRSPSCAPQSRRQPSRREKNGLTNKRSPPHAT